MKRTYSKVTRKGQVTIPAEVRRAMDIEIGDRVSFVVEDGTVRIEPAGNWVERTAGMFKGRGPVLTPGQVREAGDEAWAEEAVARDVRSRTGGASAKPDR